MKLSIVIPIYNVQDFLSTCIESVLLRGCGDYEIILVNDGSTDNSGTIAAEYAARYPDVVRLITTENGGLGAARNVGLEAAAGDYLLFLDSDDKLESGALEEILPLLNGCFDIGIFDLLQVNPSGGVIGRMPGCGRTGSFSFRENPDLLLDPPSACNKLFRRTLFLDNAVRFPGRVWFEDLRTIPKLYPQAGTITYLPHAFYRYLIRPGSITNSANVARNLEIIDAVEELIRWYKAAGLYDLYEPQLCYIAYYNVFLTASVRVNAADPGSEVQEKLLQWFLSAFPGWPSNPYIRGASRKHRLLTWLLMRRMRRCVHVIMALNDAAKNKGGRFR